MAPSWEDMDFGPFPVSEVSHCMYKLRDGTKMAMKVWLPCLKSEISVQFPFFSGEQNSKWTTELYSRSENTDCSSYPAILEYLPYAKDSSMTLLRDTNRHPWFCSHGFIDFRVDLRGSGASHGFYYDEYQEQEFEDAVELIEWISLQPWSNGRVGMYGKSWGGFNGIQVGCKQPNALKAVISLYSTDDRYADDVHYQGDCIVGDQMLSWASVMYAYNSRPPHPRYFTNIDSWKDFWLTRLQSSGNSFLTTWLQHQHKNDPYWLHGSMVKCKNKVQCPVLVIGGHADGYKNAAYRMGATLNGESRAIIGPWAHQWPDTSIAGPNIDYLGTCLQWWNYYLKDKKSVDVSNWPRLSLFIRDSIKPNEIMGSPSGTWIKLNDWNERFENFQKSSCSVVQNSNDLLYFHFGDAMSLQFEECTKPIPNVELIPHALQGANYGSWFSVDYGFAGDQTLANQHSCCWTTSVLAKDVIFSGLGKIFVAVEAQKTGNFAINVRVIDQFGCGKSTLISRGCQNLCVSDDGWASTLQAGEKKVVCIKLNGIGQKIKAGHQLVVAISPTCFPLLYPAIDSERLVIYPGECKMIFQTVDGKTLADKMDFPSPKPLLELEHYVKEQECYSSVRSVKNEQYILEINEKSGPIVYPTVGYEYKENATEQYITDKKVTYGSISATRSNVSVFHLEDGSKITAKVETVMGMTGDKQSFKTREYVKAFIDGENVFENSHIGVIPRIYV